MIRILIFILAIFPVSVFAKSFPFSKSNISSNPSVKLNMTVDRDLAYPGDHFKLYLSVQIEEGWHIYSLRPMDGNELLATQIVLEDNSFKSQKHWHESPIHLIQDEAQ
jgi:DsbC/DsbD-like thiol-disulfide interchange protein